MTEAQEIVRKMLSDGEHVYFEGQHISLEQAMSRSSWFFSNKDLEVFDGMINLALGKPELLTEARDFWLATMSEIITKDM